MIKYAREDVHYLLYIYDRMRQDLVNLAHKQGLESSQFIKSVLKKSCEVCLQKYSKPRLKDESYYNLVLRNKIILSTSKIKTLKNLLKWRFKYAAIEDEHPNYVLTNSVVFQLLDKLPKNTKELHLNFKKLSAIAKKYDNELIDLINNKSKEELPEFITIQQEKKEKLPEIPITKSSSSSLFVHIDRKQLDKEFKLVKTSVIIPKYSGHFIYENENKEKKLKETKIAHVKTSFTYENYIEYILDVHPEIKPMFNDATIIQRENAHNLKNDLDENLDKKEILEGNQKDNKKDFDFIGFSKEKQEAQLLKKKEISLNIDQEKIMNDLEKIKEIPKSLNEKYGTILNDKKSKNKRNLQDLQIKDSGDKKHKKIKLEEEVKKNGSFNKFAVFTNDKEDSDSEKEKKQSKKKKIETENDFNEISQKIISKK